MTLGGSTKPMLPPPRETHHPFGPSRLGRRILCPASYALEEEVQKRDLIPRPSEAAEEGTRLHARVPPQILLDDLDPEDQELIHQARAYLLELGGSGLYEEPVTLKGLQDEVLFTGTVDWIHPGKRISVDFKFGRLEPFKEIIEPQKRGYAAALMQRFEAPEWEARVFHVRSGVEWKGRYTDLPALQREIAEIQERALNWKDGPQPGPTQCQHCTARVLCPAFEGLALDMIPIAPSSPLSLLRRAAEVYQVIKPWIDEFRRLLSSFDDGTLDALGYERKTRQIRKIRSVEDAYGAASRWLSEAEFLRLCTVSQTAIQKALKAKGVTTPDVQAVVNSCTERIDQTLIQKRGGGEE